jgi:hypothetical protein
VPLYLVIILFSCMTRCIHALAFCVAGAPSNEEFEIEKVVKERGTGAKRSYLIKWKGWPASTNTWEPEEIVPRIYLLRYRGEPNKEWPWFTEWELLGNETGDVIVQGAIHGKVGTADGETIYTSAISEGVVREDADGKFVATLSGSYYSLEEKDNIAAEKKAAKEEEKKKAGEKAVAGKGRVNKKKRVSFEKKDADTHADTHSESQGQSDEDNTPAPRKRRSSLDLLAQVMLVRDGIRKDAAHDKAIAKDPSYALTAVLKPTGVMYPYEATHNPDRTRKPFFSTTNEKNWPTLRPYVP